MAVGGPCKKIYTFRRKCSLGDSESVELTIYMNIVIVRCIVVVAKSPACLYRIYKRMWALGMVLVCCWLHCYDKIEAFCT